MPTRRKALIALGITATLAGCSEPESEPDSEESDDGSILDNNDIDIEQEEEEDENENNNLEDQLEEDLEGSDPVEEPTSETQTILDQAGRRVDGGEYIYWEFELYRTVELNLRTTVRQGSEVDIIITETTEFNQFERGNRYRFYDVSQEDTIGDDTSQRLGAGEYVVFIYNRGRQTASVDIELTARE